MRFPQGVKVNVSEIISITPDTKTIDEIENLAKVPLVPNSYLEPICYRVDRY